jgi:hypothetical protein
MKKYIKTYALVTEIWRKPYLTSIVAKHKLEWKQK